MPVALLYRWKNAERANGWVLRARGLCNLLEQTMQRMWSSKDLDAAEQEVANHADPGELDWGTRHKAKAAQTLRYLANDKNMVSTIQAQVGAKPPSALPQQDVCCGQIGDGVGGARSHQR